MNDIKHSILRIVEAKARQAARTLSVALLTGESGDAEVRFQGRHRF